MKNCTQCLTLKRETDFYSLTPTKLEAVCKACKSEKAKACRSRKKLYKTPPTKTSIWVDNKRCPKCELVKPRTDFHKDARTISGIRVYCKNCSRMQQLSSKDRIKATVKKSRTKWRNGNPKHFKIYHAVKDAKNRAYHKNGPFDLDVEYVMSITPDFCPVFGTKFNWTSQKSARHDSPSIDRFYPEKGYVKGNVYVISWKANAMKQDATPDEVAKLAAWVDKIHSTKQNQNLDT